MKHVKVLKVDDRAEVPIYQTAQAAGADLCACLEEPMTLFAGSSSLVPTGIAVELPEGYEIQIRPRSGLAAKHGVTVLNSPGTIDSDYRGEIKVLLINHSKELFVIQHGDRIAQAVIAKHETVQFEEVHSLVETDRGDGGFGSTGVASGN